MKVLFYLPVITEAWLEKVAAPMIRALSGDADVHVIVPPPWNGTGVPGERLESLSRQVGGTWHLFDDPDHPTIRTAGWKVSALMRLVNGIAADYTICRSAEIETPRAFRGLAAFLMEGDYPPFAHGTLVRLTGPAIFSHGAMPSLTNAQQALLRQSTAGLREALRPNGPAEADARARFFAKTGLPENRPVVAVPLEHDGPDNFYMLHSPSPVNAAFVREIAAQLHQRCVLALTIHPAQRRDPRAMNLLMELEDERVRILQTPDGDDFTPTLVRHCDAAVFRDSKSIAWAALLRKPLCRISRFSTGDWLRSISTLKDLNAALGSSTRCAALEDALLWIGFHLANCAFKPDDPHFNLADLVDRIERPFNPERWLPALDRRSADLCSAAASIASLDL